MGQEPQEFTVGRAFRQWWREHLARRGWRASLRLFALESWEFLRDSLPEHRRARYGDLDYDWEQRLDTTAGSVGTRDRVLGALAGAAYQPTDPDLFRENVGALGIDCRQFTFLDLGSGKGRALFLATEYRFRRIVGVELLPALHRIAEENIARFREAHPDAPPIESHCADAREYEFPLEPLVLFLFNPLPEPALKTVIARLEESLRAQPRPAFVVYHNPVLEHVLSNSPAWERLSGTVRFAMYRARP